VELKPCKAEKQLRFRLRELRKKAGFTQEAFAEQAKFSYKYYQGIERGQWTNLRLRTLQALADGYGVSLASLLGDKCPSPAVRASKKSTPHYKKISSR
jgi:transcriptional regulator with XRE-family HTH domain